MIQNIINNFIITDLKMIIIKLSSIYIVLLLVFIYIYVFKFNILYINITNY